MKPSAKTRWPMLAEARRAARIYLAPLTAAWQALRHGGGYWLRLASLYRQDGVL